LWLILINSGSIMEGSEVGAETAERDLECCEKFGCEAGAPGLIGAGGNNGDTLSSNENEDMYGLAVVLEVPEAGLSGFLLVRPPQLSLML
jgi:hypothetical protein